MSLLGQFERNAAEAAAHAKGMQNALGAVHALTEATGRNLFLHPAAVTAAVTSSQGTQAASTLQAVIGQLNGSVGQRFLFSGIHSDTQPLSSATVLLDALAPQIAGLTSAADVAQAVSAWFDAPPGAGGFADVAYYGGPGNQPIPVGEGVTVALTTTPLSPAVRDSLKGLATAALIDRGALAGNGAERRALLAGAGKALLDTGPRVIAEMSTIGHTEQIITSAQTEGSAATATLQSARNLLREADPFATSAAISDAETRLQMLYSVIGRLSRLKLADYI